MTTFRVLIADDEPLARDQLERLIQRHEALELVASAASGTDAIRKIDATKPDVVFLDIQMPDATGLDVVRRIAHRPQVVFTTAYQQFAVTAFELQALDYLLKPFGRRRFDRAVKRLLEQGPLREPQALESSLANDPLEHLFVRERGVTRRVYVGSIVRIEAAGDYARIVTGDGDSHLLSVRMKNLEARLDPSRFVRVHRSAIVNAERIDQFSDAGNGRRVLTLSDGSTCTASRSGVARLREVLKGKTSI